MPVLKINPATPQEYLFRWTGLSCTLGRADANQLQLQSDSVSNYHASIELRGETYWLLDLNSTNGTFINGLPVSEARLHDGDAIRLGENVQLHFTCQADEPSVVTLTVEPAAVPISDSTTGTIGGTGMVVQTAGSNTAMMPQGVQCPACRTFVPFAVNFCPRCGFNLTQPTGLGFSMQQQPAGFVRPAEHSGGMSVGLLPVLALLCGLSGIFFPFAIILGLLALGQIRRHGGMESDRKQAIWGLSLGFAWALIALGIGGIYGWRIYQHNREERVAEQRVILDKQIAENEINTVTVLKGVARAEKLVKVMRLKDPSQTGKGQYMTLPELAEAGTSFFSRDLGSGQVRGYRLSIRDAGEASYLAVAEPERYNTTGRRTFTIDQSGVMRFKNADGQSFAQNSEALPVLSDVKSAFDGVDDAIAAEAIAHAKRLAAEGQYEQCQQILDEIALKFAMTGAAQELAAIKKTVDPFILEAQAQRKNQKATNAFATGDVKLGIALLKEIIEIYPTYSKISAITDELSQRDTAMLQKMDQEAKALFEQAEVCERDGKPEKALDVYVQIEKNYAATDWAKRVAGLRPTLQKSIREKTAEQLFAQVRDLSITNDYRNIINVIQQLQRGYPDTDYVGANRAAIITLFQKAHAAQYRTLAVEQMAAGKDADALARIEDACLNNPDARPAFRDLLLKLYVRVGRRRMDEGDFREALRLYRSYLALEPEQSELDPALIGKLQFSLARVEFGQGNFNNAAQLLIGARKEFEKEADYNDLFGSVDVALGNYLDALPYFDRAIAAKPLAGNYYARRGYAQLLLALQAERESMIAYAGLLRSPISKTATGSTNATPAAVRTASDSPTAANTNSAPTEPADPFVPVFATQLPASASGVKPDMQIRYDAVASQQLLDQILDLLDTITATNTSAGVRKNMRTQPKASQGNQPNQTEVAPDASSKARERLSRIRNSVDVGNALSSLRQRILDNNSRRARSVEAMNRMNQFFSGGNRDLNKAVELGADRSAELMEILKSSKQHGGKIAQSVPLIVSYLATEIDTIDRVCQMTETGYQNIRTQHLSAGSDSTVNLDLYFSRYFDRRDFDRGVQILREAGAIKVPLETYSLVPVVTVPKPVLPAKSAVPTAAQSSTATNADQ